MTKRRASVAIIGAGASGLMAAIAAARVGPHGVLLLEKEARAGRKLLATGNGRCNLLNARPDPARYHGSGAEVAHTLLQRYPPQRLLAHYAALGLICREEEDGRIYPYSGQANAVLDTLRAACRRQGVALEAGFDAVAIRPASGAFWIDSAKGDTVQAQRVIVAGGGKAMPTYGADGSAHTLLASLGHTIARPFPAIVPLRLEAEAIRGLKGVRFQGMVTLYHAGHALHTERGEGLFTDYGLSGIAAMQLARDINARPGGGMVLSIRLMDPDMAVGAMMHRGTSFAGEPMEGAFTGLLHPRIAQCILRAAGISPTDPISPGAIDRTLPLLSDWRIPVTGTLPFSNAQVTAGGAILSEFDPDTLQSHLHPGLYACGEVLDVDGDCGGYNLMWAGVSGLTAGRMGD